MTTADQMIQAAAAYEDTTYTESEIRTAVEAWESAKDALNVVVDDAVHALDHLREHAPGTIDHGMIYRYDTEAERSLDDLLGQLSGPIYEAVLIASFSAPGHKMKYGAHLPVKRWQAEAKRMRSATKRLRSAVDRVDSLSNQNKHEAA